MRMLLSVFVVSLISIHLYAAIPKVLVKKGSVIGGVSGLGYTLLDIKHTVSKNKNVERLVFEVGDINGQINKGLPGFYHVELKDKPNQLVIDMSQMPNAKVSEDQIAAKIRKSNFISNSEMVLDPANMGLNLVLNLKKNVKVKVYQVVGTKQTSKVVVDLIQ